MDPVALMVKPIPYGWSVCLTAGRELARFRGPDSSRRARRYLARQAETLDIGSIVRRAGSSSRGFR